MRPSDSSEPSELSVDEPLLPTPVAIVGVVVFCLVGALSAAIEVLLIPFYLGSHIFPITILIAVVVNVALPRLTRITVEWRWAIALPIIAWLLVLIVLGYANTGRGSVLVPGYGAGEYVGLGLFFIGALAGFVSVVRERTPIRVASARR